MRVRMKLVAGVILVMCGTLPLPAPAVAQQVRSVHPYPLFPCRPVPGRTGFREVETPEGKQLEVDFRPGDPTETHSESLYWGHPEFLCYPGAVEHVRHAQQRYLPPYPRYNRHTLVKNVVLHERADLADACIEFAEPVYWHTQWRMRIPTNRPRPVGKVYPWKPGESISLQVDGLDERCAYAVRVIGALRPENVSNKHVPADKAPKAAAEKQLVFQCEINDRPDGGRSTYVLRGRANDNFYETVSFIFHGAKDRRFNIKLTLLPESEAVLYTYNIDIHNVFGECARRRGKRRATLYDPEERKRQRAFLHKSLESGTMEPVLEALETMVKKFSRLSVSADTGAYRRLIAKATGKRKPNAQDWLGYLTGGQLPPAERQQRDQDLWNSFPPANIHFDVRAGKPAANGWRADAHGGDWEKPFMLKRKTGKGKDAAEEAYTREDFAAHKPLPGSGDRGWGVALSEETDGRTLATCLGCEAFRRYQLLGREILTLTSAYQALGDRRAARDAAFMLARLVYQYPALNPNNFLAFAERGTPEAPRRIYGPGGSGGWTNLEPATVLKLYDQLFDFIDGNRELAQALGRFIPWIKTPEDVVFLFDLYGIQYAANEMLHYRYYYDHGLARMVIDAATVQNDNRISQPWMDFIFTRGWEYPETVAGLADNIVTNTTRDGTTTIGSWKYTAAGNAGLDAAEAIAGYISTGGLKRYDVSDFRQYPKSLAGAYFFYESQPAGGYYLGVGDVGGPSKPFRADYNSKLAWRGWNLTHAPAFAWMLREIGRPPGVPDQEWQKIEATAEKQGRDPRLALHSRVFSEWSGILESGTQNDDFRFRRAVAVRVGNGAGHNHLDTLDLRLWALGCTMSGDLAQRPAYGRPRHAATYVHNLVEVDGDGGPWLNNQGRWEGYAWVRNLFDAPGAPYLRAEATPPENHLNVKLYQRQVALIDVGEGVPARRKPMERDARVKLPESYVFDVVRVSGGKRHTYCFHGCVDDNELDGNGFQAKVKNRRTLAENGETSEEQYLRRFRWERYRTKQKGGPIPEMDKQWAAAPEGDVLQATWRLDLAAEKRMAGRNGALTGKRKFMRLRSCGVAPMI